MGTDLSVFKNAALANSDAFQRLMQETKKVAQLGSTHRRISIRGGRFRQMVGGEQVGRPSSGPMNMVFVRLSDINRTFYSKAYDPEATSAPDCWSVDGDNPSPDVPKNKRKSDKCSTCPMNVKGSGQNNSRACRYSMRAAVCLEDDLETVYEFQLPATSIFGKADGNDMGMQAYCKFLDTNGLMLASLVTQVEFDEDSETPKLFFKPVRPLDEEELQAVVEAYDTEEAKEAVTLSISVSGEDEDEEPAPKRRTKAKAKPEPEEDEEDEEDEEPAPKRRTKVKAKPEPEEDEEDEEPAPKVRSKSKAKPAADDGDALASVLDAWDD